jgi:hypothetical protein
MAFISKEQAVMEIKAALENDISHRVPDKLPACLGKDFGLKARRVRIGAQSVLVYDEKEVRLVARSVENHVYSQGTWNPGNVRSLKEVKRYPVQRLPEPWCKVPPPGRKPFKWLYA